MENLIVTGSLTDRLGDLISDANTLVVSLLVVLGIIVAVIIIAKNPTVGRTIIGVCVGAFIAGLPWIIPAVGELFRGDIEGSGTGPGYAVVEEDQAPSLALEA